MSDATTVSNQSHTMSDKSHTAFPLATFLVVSVALFMVTLDNLVVTTVLPVIRMDLGASLESLEWTVNAYTLAYAVFLLTGAALGDRFGRRRMFAIGVALFSFASALAALAPTHQRARRGPRAPGPRRRDRHPADADAAGRRAARGPARPGDRRMVRRRRHGRRARPGRRRRDRRGHLLALDLLGQRADRPRARPVRAARPAREPRAERAPRPARPRARRRRPDGARARDRPRQRAGLDERARRSA